MELHDLPLLLTVEQAADFLRLSMLEVQRAIASGELTSVRCDGTRYVDTSRLLQEMGVQLSASTLDIPRRTVDRPAASGSNTSPAGRVKSSTG